MPVISMFYGLLVRMYFFDTDRHHVPHVHVEYAGTNAVFAIADAEILSGEIPKAKIRLVQAWIELRRDELMADWQLALEGQQLFKIEPLK